MNILPYSGFPALPKNIEDMHNQLVMLGLNDVEALTARIKKCEDWVDTVEETELTGNPVEFQNALAVPATSLVTTINAIQDLHGYDKPWVGGAGKNKLADNLYSDGSSNNITWKKNDDGSITVTASQTVTTSTKIDIGSATLEAGTYVLTGIDSTKGYIDIRVRIGSTSGSQIAACNSQNQSVTFTLAETTTLYFVFIVLANYTAGSLTTYPMIRLSTETDPTFAPYSNICPISGRTEVVVNRSDGDEISEDFTIQLGTTVYGADINWDTGVMTVTHANIASYNGETIGEPWISSMDEYTQGGTPTTGAQVVYPLATPQTIQLTPEQLTMLKGYNRVSIEDGTITITAYTGGPWEPITRATKKKAKTKKSKKGGN